MAMSYNREAGRDRFAFVDDVSTLSSQSIAIQQVFTPHMVQRLRVLSSAFQRVKYNKLRFIIEPQTSSATSGGYTAAFVRDPTDLVPSGVAGLNRISANRPSVAAKWWETSTLTVPQTPDLLYTSSKPGEPRWSSPGIFVLGVEGKANQAGSLTIYVEYDVVFSEPSLESESSDELHDFACNVSMYGGSRNLCRNGERTTKASEILPRSQKGAIFTFNGPRTYARNKSDQFNGIVNFLFIKHTDDDYLCPCFADGTLYTDLSYGEPQMFWQGEKAMQTASPQTQGELTGSQFLCLQPPETNSFVSWEML